jgi:ankyrin repeat protein
MQQVDIFVFFSEQRTPLHWSADQHHLEICRLLLQSNADVEAKDDE